jgi:hypothetical protein
MLTAKFYRKIPLKIINQCPELMIDHVSDGTRISQDEQCWYAFFNENGEVVGCVNMGWDRYEYKNGMPSWTIYIYLFEVAKKFKHQGYARQMVEWIENLPCVGAIELMHVDRKIDYSLSYNFWSHMGWKYNDRWEHRMIKKLK